MIGALKWTAFAACGLAVFTLSAGALAAQVLPRSAVGGTLAGYPANESNIRSLRSLAKTEIAAAQPYKRMP